MSSRKQRQIIQGLADRHMLVSVVTYLHAGTMVNVFTGSRVKQMPISIAGEMLRRMEIAEDEREIATWNQRKARMGSWRRGVVIVWDEL